MCDTLWVVSLSVTLGSSIEKDEMSCREDVMWDDELYQNQGWGTWYLYVSSGKTLDDDSRLTMDLYAPC